MPQIIEAEIDTNGEVTFLQPVKVTRKTRVIITLLEDVNGQDESKNSGRRILELLRSPEFSNRPSYPAELIDSQIEEARNSWE